jgi:hypothetical protein
MNTPSLENQLSDIEKIITTKSLTPLAMKVAIYCALRGGENQKVLRQKIMEQFNISQQVLSRSLMNLVENNFLLRSHKGEIKHNLSFANFSPKPVEIAETDNEIKVSEDTNIDQKVDGTLVATHGREPLGFNKIKTNINTINKGNAHIALQDVIDKSFAGKISPELQQTLLEYLHIRFSKKHPVTPRIIARLINKLSKFARNESEAIDLVEKAITGGWKDFYEGDYNKPKTTSYFRDKTEQEYKNAKEGSMVEHGTREAFPQLESNRSDGDEADKRIQRPVHERFERNMAGIGDSEDAYDENAAGV